MKGKIKYNCDIVMKSNFKKKIYISLTNIEYLIGVQGYKRSNPALITIKFPQNYFKFLQSHENASKSQYFVRQFASSSSKVSQHLSIKFHEKIRKSRSIFFTPKFKRSLRHLASLISIGVKIRICNSLLCQQLRRF